jgi:peroxiredoxin
LLLAALILAGAGSALYAQQFRLGEPVTDFNVENMSSHNVSYRSLKGKVTVVMFFSTRCPISNAFNYRRNTIYREYKDRVRFIAVDSNSNESLEEVKTYAKDVGFDFPVYRDLDNQVADRFGVLATTDTFVMDSAGVIQYRGYIEDALNPSRTTIQGLRLAIESVLEGKPVEIAETKARGCAIRRAKP